MKHKPYPFQQPAIDHAIKFLREAENGQRQLYAGPTGCGKSVVELYVREHFPDSWIVTPRDEIIVGLLDKLGQPNAEPLDLRIGTPVKLRNRALKGELTLGKLILDETHHESAKVWQQLDLLAGLAPAVGYTASPYRGTPRSTREFLERWGKPLWIITYKEADAEGYIKLPEYRMLPLVDDDVVEVSGGDFEVTSLTAATLDRLGDCAEHAVAWYRESRWDKPTVFAVPSSSALVRLQQELNKRGLPAASVSASTPKDLRQQIFKAVVDRIFCLIHINIISEGVDLPLRRLVDLAPTLSPVKWAQQLGRITRPAEERPEYICTNRNILRHAYILEGAVPMSAVVAAEKAFTPTQRPHTRVLGLEAIGRFKPASVKLTNGLNLYIYALSTVVHNVVIEYTCLVHPVCEPIWASKVNTVVNGEKQYGHWQRCEPPQELVGFASRGAREPSEKQLRWWQKAAHKYGISTDQEVTRKSFQALPVLVDLGVRL